ncbi:hypothetical protein DFJ74DRAFT_689615 [Hyaloraphidium curvatum]|nr:hypothetical protein DFJ74DRAFT_689615 [Hyaloraphidium curvatum]
MALFRTPHRRAVRQARDVPVPHALRGLERRDRPGGLVERLERLPAGAVDRGRRPVSLNYSLRFSTNVPLLEVTQRVRFRAAKLALAAMLSGFGAALEADDPALLPRPSGPGRPEPFEELHHLLTAAWARGIRQFSATTHLYLSVGAYAAFAAANAGAGSCVPSFYLVYVGYVAMTSLFDLVATAAENRNVAELRDLYLDAVRELRTLRDRASLPPAASRQLLGAADARAALLATFADLDRYRARLLGFVVDYGVIRTLAATALTLVVGLWSILRGLGVFVAMGTICPSR